jgi:branched-chain amino acid transport system ATP-binding protein
MTSLSVDHVTVTFGAVTALDDVSLTVLEGELAGLIGLNGAGKSTLIDAMTGFVPYRGSIRLGDDQVLDGIPPYKRARLGVVRTWQSIELFDELSVAENVWLAAEDLSISRLLRCLATGGGSRPTRAVHDILERLDIAHLADYRPTELSTGQRRLVGVARAMAGRARFILLDEPAAGLNSSETVSLGVQLRAVAELGIGILLVEHDMGLVLRSCSKLSVLHLGRLLVSGPTAEVRTNEQVVSVYLGSIGEDADPAQVVNPPARSG